MPLIIENNCSALRNTYDNFYYCGVEISKKNFDITEFASVCSSINSLKNQIYNEKAVNNLRTNYSLISDFPLTNTINIVCSVYKDKSFFWII